MCRVKYRKKEPGLIPSEVVVYLEQSDGSEEAVAVHESQVEDDSVRVSLVFKEGKRSLIELPRESSSGKWRIWVPAANVDAPQLATV